MIYFHYILYALANFVNSHYRTSQQFMDALERDE